MFITLEDLERYKACEKGKRYIRRFHPAGFEMSELVLDHHVPKTFIHWARNNLPCSEKERQLYEQRMKIQDSENYHCSHNLINTKYIKYSWNIEDSQHVFNSEFIKNSINIVKSEQVETSKNVFFSSFIEDSEKVYLGENISFSYNIIKSSAVAQSKNIYNSRNILKSSELVDCNGATFSYFCANCNNIENCLFCTNLDSQQYCIFNKPVGKERFELFVKQYNKIIKDEKINFCTWPPDQLLVLQEPKMYGHRVLYYNNLSSKFWKWVHTLPGFDSMALYNITMLPEILMD